MDRSRLGHVDQDVQNMSMTYSNVFDLALYTIRQGAGWKRVREGTRNAHISAHERGAGSGEPLILTWQMVYPWIKIGAEPARNQP